MANEMSFTPSVDFIGVGSTYDTTYGAFGVTAYQNRETLSGGGDVRLSLNVAGHTDKLPERCCTLQKADRTLTAVESD